MKPVATTTVNEEIASRIIRHDVLLQGYANHEVYQIIGYLNRNVEPDLVARLQKHAGHTLTRKRLEAMRDGVRQIIEAGYEQIKQTLLEDMVAQGMVEAQANIKILADSMPMEVTFTTPNVATIREAVRAQPIAGEFVPEWFERLTLSTQQAVNRQIMLGAIEGEGIDKIVRRIIGTRANQYTDGVLERSRRDVAAVVRTAVAGVSDNVRDEVFKANADLIKGVQWTAMLDSRTCIVCGELDGQVFEIDRAPHAPRHWNCRCSRVCVLKGWKELGLPLQEAGAGTRASNAVTKAQAKRLRKLDPEQRQEIKARLQGQVPESLTYGQWLKRQSASVQDEALGKTRAQMFRAGKMDVGSFVADNRRVLTLRELDRVLGKKIT
jgi:SPP1 gp7 family putative phage head morphogenesis protein